MQSLIILGRQPALGIAEIESLYGADSLFPIADYAVGLEQSVNDIMFSRLGGAVKLCRILTIIDSTDWADIQRFLLSESPKHADMLPEGKLTIGFSTYGIQTNPKRMLATGLSVKKAIKSSGRPVRLVPNPELALSSAQVLHNQLTAERAWELVFVRDGTQTIVAQTTHVQDIDNYTLRDRGRPKRDARVGMLPPKLAQIIINLAVADTPTTGSTVLDPFCGTGVILQESQMMGYDTYGTDLEPRMVEYSEANIEWLQNRLQPIGTSWRIEQADATQANWAYQFTAIACETYLGRPFSALPKPDVLQQVMQDVNLIHKKFLQNVARQTKPGFRMCIAVPAWKTPQGFKHLKTLEILPELGYTRIEFAHARADNLIYHREGQVVGRELVVLVRK
jgi:tRNA (guanine10-N2)-dimethyltransferase